MKPPRICTFRLQRKLKLFLSNNWYMHLMEWNNFGKHMIISILSTLEKFIVISNCPNIPLHTCEASIIKKIDTRWNLARRFYYFLFICFCVYISCLFILLIYGFIGIFFLGTNRFKKIYSHVSKFFLNNVLSVCVNNKTFIWSF